MARDVAERFFAKVTPGEGGCIVWTNYRTPHGYGVFYVNAQNAHVYAHRWSYEYHVGPIPDGLVIDHLCRNTSCVNPKHLEPVTHRENVKRGIAGFNLIAMMLSKTACPKGHLYSIDNIYTRPGGTERGCKTCRREATRQWRLRNQPHVKAV